MPADPNSQPIRVFPVRSALSSLVALALVVLVAAWPDPAWAESTSSNLIIRSARGKDYDPFESFPSKTRVAGRSSQVATQAKAPVDDPAYFNPPVRLSMQPRASQQEAVKIEEGELPSPADREDPCAGLAEKPLDELGIGIALPTGELPTDQASACWDQLNQSAGPLAAMRFWPVFVYNWNATCLCHRPLYFEEINLERNGYGCPGCLQWGVSAAHFFGTIPALPYCMAADCPWECVYTLGHDRPGSCPPWRHHWPPCDPLAAAAEGGVWTGLIFLIP